MSQSSDKIRKRRFSLKFLRDTFHEFGGKDDITVQALVLYLIGSVITSFSNATVPLIYLKFLKNIENIKDYAWGVAMLAILQTSLRRVRLGKVKMALVGHSYFLSVRTIIYLFYFYIVYS